MPATPRPHRHLGVVHQPAPGTLPFVLAERPTFAEALAYLCADWHTGDYAEIHAVKRRGQTYDQDIFERKVKERVADAIRWGDAPRGLARAIKEFLADADSTHEQGAHEELRDFAYYVDETDRYDLDKQPDFAFSDTWEWDLRDYDWWFLWACYAIVWGIARYDEAKQAVAA